jgi:hypothetical protein
MLLGFKRKLSLWKNHVVKEKLEMFSPLLGLENEEAYHQISILIRNHRNL